MARHGPMPRDSGLAVQPRQVAKLLGMTGPGADPGGRPATARVPRTRPARGLDRAIRRTCSPADEKIDWLAVIRGLSQRRSRPVGGRGRGGIPALALAAQIVLCGAAWAGSFADCARDAADEDLAAKSEFQRALRALIVRERPEFEALATVYMELQILLAEAQWAKLDYLLAHDPDRIDAAHGLGRFRTFEWSEEDAAGFLQADPSNRAMTDRIATLTEQNNEHPDWPELRAYFASELARSPDFTGLMARFGDQQEATDALLATCRRD